MNKSGWIISLIIFITTTVFVLFIDDTKTLRRVKFQNKTIGFTNETPGFSNGNIVKITNEETKISDKSVKSDFQDTAFNNKSEYSNSGVEFHNKSETYKNKYKYKKIDWGTWKSNFINAILDDSLEIEELDKYNEGAWFFYSFEVNDEGQISNIIVRSVYLEEQDKARIKDFIKSYEYSDLTVFPANTNRKYAKVSAIMVLSDMTKKSNPRDFNDTESIKIQY